MGIIKGYLYIRYTSDDHNDNYIVMFYNDWTRSDEITIWSRKPEMFVRLLYTYVAEYCDLLIEKNKDIIIENRDKSVQIRHSNSKNLRHAIHTLVKLPGRIWPPLTSWPIDILE